MHSRKLPDVSDLSACIRSLGRGEGQGGEGGEREEKGRGEGGERGERGREEEIKGIKRDRRRGNKQKNWMFLTTHFQALGHIEKPVP